MGKPGEYHLLSASEKRQFAVDRIREPDIACPYCGTRTLVKDLVEHIAHRCSGLAPLHQRSTWIPWAEAIALGVDRRTLSRWISQGRVRSRGKHRHRVYLLRDVVTAISLRRRPTIRRALECRIKAEAKPLTKPAHRRQKRKMALPLDIRVRRRLKRFADKVGGYAPASRKLDISSDTIRRAVVGGKIRRGTAALIELQLREAEGSSDER